MSKKVYWASLQERNPVGVCADFTLAVGVRAGHMGYTRLVCPYGQTATVRNLICAEFLKQSSGPRDTLVMLDADHAHPDDVIERLVARDGMMIVGALAQRRGPPYDPIAFVTDANGDFHSMAEWKPGEVYACDGVSPAAIAIQRRVFGHLEAEGFLRPWFRYEYKNGVMEFPTEDMYWMRTVRDAKIKSYVDTGIVCPHYTAGWITPETWYDYRRDHPELLPQKVEDTTS